MNNNQAELDTIVTEHRFMEVGDPVPVNRFDQHDVHIVEHNETLKSLSNENESVYKQQYIDLLKAHITLHEEMKKSI